MTDPLDVMLVQRFACQMDHLPGPDFADVRRRVKVVRKSRTEGFAIAWTRRRVAGLVLAASFAIAGGAGAFAYIYLGPSPGFTAGVSAFDRLPPATWPDAIPRVGLERAAAYLDISPTEAEERLRLLRTGLPQGDLYAFPGSSGTVCVFLSGHFGDCLNASNAPRFPGVLTTISPGYPNEAPAVVGIVADNVAKVALIVSGQRRELPIVNNSVYADLASLRRGQSISLETVYADGTVKEFPLLNPKGVR